MMSVEMIIAVLTLLTSGVSLVFILKIMFNELHELRDLLTSHLRDHAKGELR